MFGEKGLGKSLKLPSVIDYQAPSVTSNLSTSKLNENLGEVIFSIFRQFTTLL